MRYLQLCCSLIIAITSLAVAVGDELDLKPPGWFTKLDRDGNGSLDAKEAERFLGALDTDEDGTISVAEAAAYVERHQKDAERKSNRPRRGQMLFRAQELGAIEKTGNGLWVVSIGHSCVIPAIDPCITISRSAGYANHTHLMQFSGGGSGAPKAQWTYTAAMAVSSSSIDSVVETLLQKYPGRVHVLPAGLAMTELVRRFTNNDLPGVDALVVASKQKKEGLRAGLYRDKIHPTDLIAALEGYIYYACLYRQSPLELETGIYRDDQLDRTLREVAWQIVTDHPRSGVTK